MRTTPRSIAVAIAAGAGLLLTSSPLPAGTFFIDFGAPGMETSGLGWTNIVHQNGEEPTFSLKDGSGLASGVKLKITDKFNSGVINQQGTVDPIIDAVIFSPSSTRDSFFGHTGPFGNEVDNPSARLVFSGFNPARVYQFIIFASRMGVDDNRETKYEIIGRGEALVRRLNASNNTSAVAVFEEVRPSPAGEIVLNVSAGENNTNGSRFYYLGAICITDPITIR